MSDVTAITIAITALYSTGHWKGATFLLFWLAWGLLKEANESPLDRVQRILRG